eukprot:gene3077-13098_t
MNKLVFIALALFVGLAQAHEFAGPHTKELTASNYDDEIAYFAPWCGHCKTLAPKFQELGTELKDNADVEIAFVDCTQHRDICQTAGVKGYPTIKIIHNSEEYQAYRGPREVANLKAAAVDAVEALLKEAS